MKRSKQILYSLPEYILLLAFAVTFVCDLVFVGQFNYSFLILSVAVVALLIWKSKLLAGLYSVVLGLGSTYMILALLSEFREFPAGDPEGLKMLIVGGVLILCAQFIAVSLALKYVVFPSVFQNQAK